MDEPHGTLRRTFLKQAVGLAGAAALPPAESTAAGASSIEKTPADAAAPYLSLSPDEATFVEALMNVLCPADEFTPNGVDCGLATYLDRQLAGPFGRGDGRYQRGPFRSGKPQLGLQMPLTPEQLFKAGIEALDRICLKDHGKVFARLAPAEADRLINDVADGKVRDARVPLASWFNEVVYPLFVEGCFADPMYGGNRSAVFWKMVGYPGLPATHTLDMVRYRGRPFPNLDKPKSIADFT